LLTDAQIETNARAVPLWRVSEDKKRVSKKFTAKNWRCAFDFLNSLSRIAEAEGHHPDVHLTNYRDVEIIITTHAIEGLSLHDFVLAAKLDQVEVVYSPRWVRENAIAE
jgi:4a-hydroxytetrahydrobiopterin dehydratase